MTAPGPPTGGGRYWEVDALRGVAIVMMVLFHLGWDLHYFGLSAIDVFEEPWIFWGRATATLFLLLVGVSLQISAGRSRRVGGEAAVWRRQWRRALVVLGAAGLVTLATWLALGEGFVVFGILHLIGVSMLLAFPLLRLGLWNLALAAACFAGGVLVQSATASTSWLLPLGVRPAGFTSVDYYPLLPWFGVVLVGLALGGVAYGPEGRRFRLPDPASPAPLRPLGWLGRHALAIYLLHQPLLIAGLILSGLVPLAAFR